MSKEKATKIFEFACKLFKNGLISAGEVWEARVTYDTYARKW